MATAVVPNQFAIGKNRMKDHALSPAAQLFIECAREVAKPLAKKTS